jgi:hypothetical protein
VVTAAGCGTAPATPRASVASVATTSAPPTKTSAPAQPGPSASAAAPGLHITTLSAKLPTGTSRAVAFDKNGSILLAGGLTASGTVATISLIHVPDGSVQLDGRLASAVHDAGGALLGGTPTIFGGGNLAPEKGVQQLGAGGGIVGELPRARADLVVVDVGDTAVVVGGGTPARLDPAVLATTDGARFRALAMLPHGVRYPAVAVVGGVIVVVGGTDGVHDRTEIETIDPATGIVSIVGNLRHGLSHATAFVLDGKLLIVGGRSAGVAQDTILAVDPTNGSVGIAGHLPKGVSDAAGAVVDGVAYLIGGENGDFLASVIAIELR